MAGYIATGYKSLSIVYFFPGRQGAIVARLPGPGVRRFPAHAVPADLRRPSPASPASWWAAAPWRSARWPQLLAAGARVTVKRPSCRPGLEAAGAAGRIAVARRPFDPALVPLQLLVIAATGDPAVNHAVAAAARAGAAPVQRGGRSRRSPPTSAPRSWTGRRCSWPSRAAARRPCWRGSCASSWSAGCRRGSARWPAGPAAGASA